MTGECFQNIIGHHRQFIDDHPTDVLVPGKDDVDIRVPQRALPANTDISACVNCITLHGMGYSVLECDAQELILMLPSERLYEQAPHPMDHTALASPRRPVAKTEQWLLC